jgi:LPXTG-site transpeptidase (sortase) family protein
MHLDRETLRLLFFRTLGNFMVLMSMLMIGKTFLPAVAQELNFAYRRLRKLETRVVAQSAKNPQPTQAPTNPFLGLLNKLTESEEVIVPADPAFSIVIPKIAANSRIIANVDTSNYDQYIKALGEGVAHAQGTAFPGDQGHIYLFAHSTDNILNVGTYNAVFYLLYKLEQKDEIYLFYQGKKHVYQVVGKRVVKPTEIHYLTRSSAEEFLTLQTCWPPGTTLERMLIFATPVVK